MPAKCKANRVHSRAKLSFKTFFGSESSSIDKNAKKVV